MSILKPPSGDNVLTYLSEVNLPSAVYTNPHVTNVEDVPDK